MLHQNTRAAKLPDSLQKTSKETIARRRRKQSVPTRALLESLENRRLLADILGSAAAFAALAGSTVTNTGSSAIVGDVGVSPGSAVTGFPPGVVSGGSIHAGDVVASTAEADLATAYGVIAGEASPPANNLSGTDLAGLTLTPGVYRFNTAAQLTGTLTLNAQDNPDARFDIQIGTTLTTASDSAIVLTNGAQADNVYFQVGSSATLGSDTAFEGNILAHTSVTLDSGSSISQGRALAVNGAVTMNADQVSIPDADVSVTNTAAANPVLAGDTITYTVTVNNAGPMDAQTIALTDVLPVGATFVSETQTSGPTFTMTDPAVGSTGTINGSIGALAPEASASFTLVAQVPSTTMNGATFSDAATVSSDTVDPNLENNSQTVTTNLTTQADLSATTTATHPALIGDNISDVLPAGTTFVSDSQTSGPTFNLTNPPVGDTGTISGTADTLASGASATFTIVALVSDGTPDGTTIEDTASASAVTADPNSDNNSQELSVGVGSTVTVVSAPSRTTASVHPTLSVLGADTGSLGEAGLTYTWSVVRAPSGAKPVKFSVNGTNAAKNAAVRVQKDGTYLLHCVVANSFGDSVTASVELVIKQVATSLRLTPHAQTIAAGASVQYRATAMDQFAHPMRTAGDTTYAVKFGDGTINTDGMFAAGQFQSHIVIQMTDDDLIGTLGATVV
jgi:uncharacterized repeat protein (TIGR01451 family)